MKMSLSSSSRKHDRSVRRSRHARPMLEGLEDRLVLSLVAVSASDAKINTTTSIDQTLPSVAMDASGDYVVVWDSQGEDGSGYGIYVFRRRRHYEKQHDY